ncbi:MAG TPA: glucose-1-phosphate cytidylyltransferase [Polyangia bacterium]
MKVAILAGGFGTRLAEETENRPKPMVEIGARPLLWHIMKHYAHYGVKDFFVALGYKGDTIKRYFVEYGTLSGSLTVDLARGKVTTHERECEDWTVNLVETGLHTNTGGRLRRLRSWLGNETFMLTYGDGVSNVDIEALLKFHRSHKRIATVTAVRPPSRFGGLVFDGDRVVEFTEKSQIGEGWINGGFMVLQPEIFEYIQGDDTSLEAQALDRIASEGQLMAYRHNDFWQCMDNVREKRMLETLWEQQKAPWKVWG